MSAVKEIVGEFGDSDDDILQALQMQNYDIDQTVAAIIAFHGGDDAPNGGGGGGGGGGDDDDDDAGAARAPAPARGGGGSRARRRRRRRGRALAAPPSRRAGVSAASSTGGSRRSGRAAALVPSPRSRARPSSGRRATARRRRLGKVYRARLGEGHGSVAIKRLDAGGMQGDDEFVAEIAFLAELLHPNLVRLLGYAHAEGASGGERALVYELLAGGALDDRLARARGAARPLTWAQRLSVALDRARGLHHLHSKGSTARRAARAASSRSPRLSDQRAMAHIHCDIKSANILLDEHDRAKLCDFGLMRKQRARAADGGNGRADAAQPTMHLRGSWGYICPEYARTGRVSTKVDIYAYGVVMLELLTGLPAIDERCDPRDLVARVQPKLAALASSGGGAAAAAAADALLDAHARGWPADSAAGFAEITGACLAASSAARCSTEEMLGAVVSLESLALEKAAESALNSGAAAKASSAPRRPPPPPRRRPAPRAARTPRRRRRAPRTPSPPRGATRRSRSPAEARSLPTALAAPMPRKANKAGALGALGALGGAPARTALPVLRPDGAAKAEPAGGAPFGAGGVSFVQLAAPDLKVGGRHVLSSELGPSNAGKRTRCRSSPSRSCASRRRSRAAAAVARGRSAR